MSTTHLADRDLLLAVDGELAWWRKRSVRAHLATCETCRMRAAHVAATLARAEAGDDAVIPDAAEARARLSVKLSNQAAMSRAGWRADLMSPRVAAATGLALLVAVVGLGRLPADERAGVFLRPRADLTPGVTRSVTLAEICGTGRFRQLQGISSSVHAQVFASYGADFDVADQYELDYLITPELGGADEPANLWPQPFSWTPWNAYVKDELEVYLHAEVCAGRMDLATAQREIAGDWIASYQRHFNTTTPRRDYARQPLTIADTAMVLSELGEQGIVLLSSHAPSTMRTGLQ